VFRGRYKATPVQVAVVSDGVHTLANPYCDDMVCWCHTDLSYHARVTGSPSTDGEYTGSLLGGELDGDLFEYAMATLGGG
jgi:hypothetical protein